MLVSFLLILFFPTLFNIYNMYLLFTHSKYYLCEMTLWLQPHRKKPCPDKGTAPGKRIAVIIWANEQDHVPRMVREKNPGMRHLFSKVAVHSFMQKPSDLGNTKGVLASFLGYPVI